MEKFYRALTHMMVIVSVGLALFGGYVLIAGKIGESKIENIDSVKSKKISNLGFDRIAEGKIISKAESDYLRKNNYYFLYSGLDRCPQQEDLSKNDSLKNLRLEEYNRCKSLGITEATFREEVIQELMSVDVSAKQIKNEAEKGINSIESIAFMDDERTNMSLMATCLLMSITLMVLTTGVNAISFFRRRSQETQNS